MGGGGLIFGGLIYGGLRYKMSSSSIFDTICELQTNVSFCISNKYRMRIIFIHV